MKKVILTTALTGLLSLSFTLTANQDLILAQSSQAAQTQIINVPVAKVGVGKIRPGISEQEVRRILGRPISSKTEFTPGIGDNIRTLQYPNISLSLIPHVNKPNNFFVYQFVSRDRQLPTPTGIKIGDTQAQVIKVYGKPSISKQGTVTFLGYSVEHNDSFFGAFSFRIEAGKVTEIRYSEPLT
jgi:outer membrane protein assembly factor BamE (lipoprotein component of BamABCDE complex)